jgi:ABC-type multidrug transport system ATPase subunit
MIRIEGVSKRYGKQTVLDQVSLSVESGQAYGLLGRNGAGKTTLTHLMLDLLEPDAGRIGLFGQPHSRLGRAGKRRLGFMGDSLAITEELSGEAYLQLTGRIYGLASAELARRISSLFGYFFEELSDLRKPAAQYSTGMKQKLAFCAAVLHSPDLLILDEPFSGLDPLAAGQLIAFLRQYLREGRALFISSHDLSCLEQVATHVGVLDQRRMQFDGSLADFTAQGARKLDTALLDLLKPRTAPSATLDWI